MTIFKSEITIKVPFFDNDPMGIVWHGNYIKYLEIARCDMFDKIGYNYIAMKEDGLSYPLAKMDFKFISPATFNQELKIVTTLEEIEPAIIIRYEIVDFMTGKKILKAKSMQIRVNIDNGKSEYFAPIKLKELLNV